MSQNKKEVSFKVIIEPYSSRYSFYVKYSASEAQDLYNSVKRELEVHGGCVQVKSETITTNIHKNPDSSISCINEQSGIRNKEIEVWRYSKKQPVPRGFLPWIAAHGVKIKS